MNEYLEKHQGLKKNLEFFKADEEIFEILFKRFIKGFEGQLESNIILEKIKK